MSSLYGLAAVSFQYKMLNNVIGDSWGAANFILGEDNTTGSLSNALLEDEALKRVVRHGEKDAPKAKGEGARDDEPMDYNVAAGRQGRRSGASTKFKILCRCG